jgi:hypothetical protein
VEQIPVKTCKMVATMETISVPRVVERRIPVTVERCVPRTVVMRVPLDTCGNPGCDTCGSGGAISAASPVDDEADAPVEVLPEQSRPKGQPTPLKSEDEKPRIDSKSVIPNKTT